MSNFAVIGSGATGYVSALTLREAASRARIQIFHGGGAAQSHELMQVDHPEWPRDALYALHEEIRREVGLKFPPPKSHFGELVPRHASPPGTAVWRSRAESGLTRYWSASLFPFTTAELEEWGVDADAIGDCYAWVADEVGLAAVDDGLSRYFGPSYGTLPALRPTRLAERLITEVERNTRAKAGGVIAGLNRASIETRAGERGECIRCGGCFYGCPRESVFDAGLAMRRAEDRLAAEHVHERVLLAKPVSGGIMLETEHAEHGPFERVFCAAGCVGTAELVSRSFLGGEGLEFVDNELCVVPFFYIGGETQPEKEHLAIANAIVGLLPDGHGDDRYAEAHVAPVPDLLTRFYSPAYLDSLATGVAAMLRRSILLAKVYLHSDTAPRYTAVPSSDDVVIEAGSVGRGSARLRSALRRLRRGLDGTGFWLPGLWPALRSTTSSHYAGGLDANSKYPADLVTGEIEPGFHVVDSSLMPFSPAQPLTFTSMANARRIVRQVMNA